MNYKQKSILVFSLTALLLSLPFTFLLATAGSVENGSIFRVQSNTAQVERRATSAPIENQVIMARITEYEKPKTRTISAWVTKYTLYEGCSNPQCLNASRAVPVRDKSVACPRSIKIGRKIEIGGHTFECDDRYARWVQTRQGGTFDIFAGETKEDNESAILFGKKKLEVTILQ